MTGCETPCELSYNKVESKQKRRIIEIDVVSVEI